jgi:hypothetical protein
MILERFPAKAWPGLDPGVNFGSREENDQDKDWRLDASTKNAPDKARGVSVRCLEAGWWSDSPLTLS